MFILSAVVVYFNQLLGAAHTQMLVETLFLSKAYWSIQAPIASGENDFCMQFLLFITEI